MLDSREISTLSYLAEGYKPAELPALLNCSIQTVWNIMRDVKNKTGATTPEHAIYLCHDIIEKSLSKSLKTSSLKI